jgi:hypothetical protein
MPRNALRQIVDKDDLIPARLFYNVRNRGQVDCLKGQCHEFSLLLVFFMGQFSPPTHEYPIRTVSNFFRKFMEIFASKGAPPVSTTLGANFATSFASVLDTGGKIWKQYQTP